MDREYAVGETDSECWVKLWKASAGDPEVDYEEWKDFSDNIEENLRKSHEDFLDQFYFWNDFAGDRTLDLKIAGLSVLTTGLVCLRQRYLQVNGQQMWRVRTPIYFGPDSPQRVIVIYPHALDTPAFVRAAEH
jgi:hypothetical protein